MDHLYYPIIKLNMLSTQKTNKYINKFKLFKNGDLNIVHTEILCHYNILPILHISVSGGNFIIYFKLNNLDLVNRYIENGDKIFYIILLPFFLKVKLFKNRHFSSLYNLFNA